MRNSGKNINGMDQDRERRLRRLQTIAQAMDAAFFIPGTNIRFGADAFLGLVPGTGDLTGSNQPGDRQRGTAFRRAKGR